MFDFRRRFARGFAAGVIVAAAGVLSTGVSHAGLAEGIRAYDGGDYETAFKEFLLSDTEAESQYYLGNMYITGQGVRKNYSAAWGWYLKAAKGNHVEAQLILAQMFEKGQGIPKDWVEAGKWHRKAAEGGNVGSQARLGQMLLVGMGMPRNIYEATIWLQKAAEGGHAGAQGRLDELYREGALSKNQVLYGIQAGNTPPSLSKKGLEIRDDLKGIFKAAWGLTLGGQRKDKGSGVKVGGDIITYERDDSLLIILPFVTLHHSDGSVTDMGTLRVRVTPEKDRAFYRIMMAFSGRIVTRSSAGIRTGITTFEELQVSGLWSRELKEFLEVDIKTGDLRGSFTGADLFEVGELIVNFKLVEKEPGFWSGPTLIRVRDLRLGAKSLGASLSIARFTVRGENEGMRKEAYKKFQKDLGIDLETGEWNSDVLTKGFKMPDVYPLFGRSSWVEVSIDGIEVVQNQVTKVKLGNSTFAFAARGLEEELGELAFRGGYRGLEFEGEDSSNQLIPKTISYEAKISRVPAQKILSAAFGAGIRAAAAASAMAAMGDAPAAGQLEKLIQGMNKDIVDAFFQAQTEFVLSSLKIDSDSLEVSVEGNLQADAQAVRKFFGAFTVEIKGLDKLMETPEITPVIAENAESLSLLRKMGKDKTDSDGALVITYRIDVTREGPILLNGQDSTKVMDSFQTY